MKRAVAIILVACIFQIENLKAQVNSVTKEWGPELQRENRNDRFLQVIGADENGAYLAKFDNRDDLFSIE